MPEAQVAAPVPPTQPAPVVGHLRRVQTSWSGVSLLVDTPYGPVNVPLPASTCNDLPHALVEALGAQERMQALVSNHLAH